MITLKTKRLFINIYRVYLYYPILIFYLRIKKSKDNDIYIFHHIPKTAGTSFNTFLKKNFFVFKDYTMDWSNNVPKPLIIKDFDSKVCISGHYDFYEGCSPDVHYDDQLKRFDKKFKKIVFLRDPFELRVSLFKYLKLNNQIATDYFFEDFLFEENNFIAKSLVCTESNYKEVLDKYFFVGLSEYYDDSLSRLSNLLELDYNPSPRKNVSKETIQINTNLKSKFQNLNSLDYNIYNYILNKFHQN